MNANESGGFLQGGGNVLVLYVGIVIQLCILTKRSLNYKFKWMSLVVCKLYLKTDVRKKTKKG